MPAGCRFMRSQTSRMPSQFLPRQLYSSFAVPTHGLYQVVCNEPKQLCPWWLVTLHRTYARPEVVQFAFRPFIFPVKADRKFCVSQDANCADSCLSAPWYTAWFYLKCRGKTKLNIKAQCLSHNMHVYRAT